MGSVIGSLTMRDLIRISSELLQADPRTSSINPWLVSQVIPPLASLEIEKDKQEESGKDQIGLALRSFAGIDRPRGVQASLWEYLSDTVKLPDPFFNYLRRLRAALKSIRGTLEDLELLEETYVTITRFMVGIGIGSAWEAGLASLQPFGVPWVPGSSLKGALRHTMILEIFEEIDKLKTYKGAEDALKPLTRLLGISSSDEGEGKSTGLGILEELTLEDLGEKLSKLRELRVPETLINKVRSHAILFGTKKFEGTLVCIGGFPVGGERILGLDVVNPHYSSYYGSDPERPIPPSEWSEPSPFFYPVISKGVTFKFLLLTPRKHLQLVKHLLQKTLTEEGLGAKTGVGYGLFKRLST